MGLHQDCYNGTYNFSFSIKANNVFVNIEFFPHAIIMEDSLLIGPSNDDSSDVDTLLNLWNH